MANNVLVVFFNELIVNHFNNIKNSNMLNGSYQHYSRGQKYEYHIKIGGVKKYSITWTYG